MLLNDLITQALPGSDAIPKEVEINGVTDRSNQVERGSLFVAIPGVSVDGHRYIGDAVANGAVAVVGSQANPDGLGSTVYVRVKEPRRALARLLHAFHGFPLREMDVFGVTGTNGKSTTTYLIESILRAAGKRPGLIGTIEYRFGATRDMAAQTTPHPAVLMGYIDEMKCEGVNTLVMEVSSHALVQDRVEAVPFRVATLTNITHEHFDYHGTHEAYVEAKWKLFGEHLTASPNGVAVLNLDDPAGADFYGRFQGEALSYGFASESDVRASGVQSDDGGIRFTLESPKGSVSVRSPLAGDYNVSNILAAAASGLAAEIPIEAVATGIENMRGVPGRFERLKTAAPFEIYLDFAHTPDALDRVLASARRLAGRGRLLCVFGAGGDRDPSKRGPMGAAVARHADRAIITKDNSRFEDPKRITAMLAEGMDSVADSQCRYDVILDRGEAIRTILGEAQPGDLVFIAGKGHELYENERGELRPWDDREVVQEVLGKLSGRENATEATES